MIVDILQLDCILIAFKHKIQQSTNCITLQQHIINKIKQCQDKYTDICKTIEDYDMESDEPRRDWNMIRLKKIQV